MEKIIIDAETLAKLHNLDSSLEFCAPDGQLLGYFNPVQHASSDTARKRSPFSEEELRRRRERIRDPRWDPHITLEEAERRLKEDACRTTAEVLERLERLK